VAPFINGNKKAQSHHIRRSGQWPTTDSMQVRYKYQHPSVVDILLRAESDTRPSSLDLVH